MGDVIFRGNGSRSTHKIHAIKKIIHDKNASGKNVTDVIMIGDNGEMDPQLYNEVVKFFKNAPIRFHVFIHQVYRDAAKLEAGQIGYATPLEIALSLEMFGYLNRESVDKLAEVLLIKMKFVDSKNSATMFPSWMDCGEVQWLWHEESMERAYAMRLFDVLLDKCNLFAQ